MLEYTYKDTKKRGLESISKTADALMACDEPRCNISLLQSIVGAAQGLMELEKMRILKEVSLSDNHISIGRMDF